MQCPSCGQMIAPNTRFCGNCGAALTPPAPQPPVSFGYPPAPPPRKPVPWPWIGGGAGLIVVLAIALVISLMRPDAPTPAPAPAPGPSAPAQKTTPAPAPAPGKSSLANSYFVGKWRCWSFGGGACPVGWEDLQVKADGTYTLAGNPGKWRMDGDKAVFDGPLAFAGPAQKYQDNQFQFNYVDSKSGFGTYIMFVHY